MLLLFTTSIIKYIRKFKYPIVFQKPQHSESSLNQGCFISYFIKCNIFSKLLFGLRALYSALSNACFMESLWRSRDVLFHTFDANVFAGTFLDDYLFRLVVSNITGWIAAIQCSFKIPQHFDSKQQISLLFYVA